MIITKLKKLNDNKHVSLWILKISSVTLFGCRVNIIPDIKLIYMVRWIGLVLITYENHRQTDKQTEIINRMQREHTSLTTKLVISFIWGKINPIATV